MMFVLSLFFHPFFLSSSIHRSLAVPSQRKPAKHRYSKSTTNGSPITQSRVQSVPTVVAPIVVDDIQEADDEIIIVIEEEEEARTDLSDQEENNHS